MEQYHGFSDRSINISDVIEVIQTTDPTFAECNGETQGSVDMIGGRVEVPHTRPVRNNGQVPYVEIIEQPASKALRFRYECEGRSAGSIPGVNSSPENKTYPSIRIANYKGRAVVVVSCVTKDPPYRPHPHNLVGKEGCRQGVCMMNVNSENMTISFANLGIQCVKKKDIEEALKIREEIRVDPFKTGFDHRRQPTSIDLNAVRLCFQVFLKGSGDKCTVPLDPIVSDPIFDKKAMSDLVITKLSHCSASVAGGLEMVLLCEKVAKEDIQVRFYEERNGQIVWEGLGDFQPTHVHKQVAIVFRTPSYRSQQVEQPIQVYIQLRRPSDGATSDSLPFQMLPLGSDDHDSLKRKRQKFNDNPRTFLLRHAQLEGKNAASFSQSSTFNFNLVKPEPSDRLSPYGANIGTGTASTLVPLNPVVNTHMPASMQSYKIEVSADRTPSPLEAAAYNVPSYMQYQQNMPSQFPPQSNSQALGNIQMQSNNYMQPPGPSHQQDRVMNKLMAEQVNNNYQPQMRQDGFDNVNVNSTFDMDTQQYNFDVGVNLFSSEELALLGTNLSENLSSGLSLSESSKMLAELNKGLETEAANVAENANMTDTFTRIANTTIQQLCSLNESCKRNMNN